MGTRLYPLQDEAVYAAVLGIPLSRVSELLELDRLHQQVSRALRDEHSDFNLWTLAQAIPDLPALSSLILYGFGKFDLSLLPEDESVAGSMEIDDPRARALVESSSWALPTSGLYETLVSAGCHRIHWG